MLFDTHTHLDDTKFDADRTELIESLRAAGICPVLAVSADRAECFAALALAEQYDFIYAAVGYHPDAAQRMNEEQFDELRRLADHEKVRAIGEIGLDYHWPEDTDKEKQLYWFRRQMALAREMGLPVSIHSRDASADTLTVLKEFPEVHGVMHCFAGSVQTMQEVLKLGFYIALGGVVTFKNARVAKEVARAVPPDRLLLETDCPYLAPEPHRGERNSPLFLPLIAQTIADIKGMSVQEVCDITRQNGLRLFSIEENFINS